MYECMRDSKRLEEDDSEGKFFVKGLQSGGELPAPVPATQRVS